MNRKILQGLFSGDIITWERKEHRSEELLEVVRKIEEEERYFISKMSLDDCERFQRLSNLYLQLSSAAKKACSRTASPSDYYWRSTYRSKRRYSCQATKDNHRAKELPSYGGSFVCLKIFLMLGTFYLLL